MNAKLQSVQTALEKVNQIATRRREIEAEQGELKNQIQTLTTAVAGGDAKSVNALTIAKARADVLPGELAAVEQKYTGAIAALRDTMPALSPLVAKAYGKEYQRVQAIADEFLRTHLEDEPLIELLTSQITQNSKTVHALDFLNTRFHSLQTSQIISAQTVISRATDALDSLANVL